MKKFRDYDGRILLRFLPKKTIRVMKLILILSLLSVIQLWATETYSQLTHISLKLDDVTISEVLDEIEHQSEFFFLYSPKLIDVERKVNIDAKDETIMDILAGMFDNSVKFVALDRQVILSPNEQSEILSDLQQQKLITGTVTDENGTPLPGVNVVVTGTTQGTMTDIAGKYSIEVPPGAMSLTFSFIGMNPQEINIGTSTQINATMAQSLTDLEEVVVIGYGKQKKVNLTGAVSSLDFNSEEIKSRALQNVSTAISGMSSGVVVRQRSGHPSENEASIAIRGIGSLNMSAAPLVIIDGIVGDMSTVHPNDVESISILKDAASAAIYGSRASNGVILVTTKRGSDTNGKLTFNYDGYYGVFKPTQWHDLVTNTADHLEMVNLLETNSGFAAPYSQARIDEWRTKSQTDPIGYPNTDFNQWYLDNTDNYLQNHNFSANGGNDKVKFSTSFNYQENSGLVPNTSTDQYTFRNNLTYKVSKYLTLGNDISYLYRREDPMPSSTIWSWAMAAWPGQVPRLTVGKDIDIPGQPYGKVLYGHDQEIGIAYGGNNPVYYAESTGGQDYVNALTGKLFAIVSPLKGWDITGSYLLYRNDGNGYSNDRYTERWNFQNMTQVTTPPSTIKLYKNWNKSERQVFDLYSNYEISFDDHSLNFLAGYNQEQFFMDYTNVSKEKMLNENLVVFDAASGNPTASGSGSDYALKSFFGRVNYSYKGKYLLEGNFRYDGSSRFAPDNRWGFFPSGSAAWRITKEDFWSVSAINDLKLRLSYGQLGNAGISDYEWQNFYQPATVAFGDIQAPAVNYISIANKEITWETTTILNIGIDVQLIDKIYATFNYYNKYTDGILVREPIPLVNGGLNAPRVNSAEVSNKGYELELNYETFFGDLSFRAGAMLSYNQNTIEKYKGDFKEPYGWSVWTEGQPIGIYYLREIDYIVTDISQVNNMIADGFTFLPGTPGVGDFMYKNTNGDKIINDADRVMMGNPTPKYTYNANIALGYKGFDLFILADGVAKWDRVMKGSIYDLQHLTGTYMWPKSYYGTTWTADNPNAKIPKVYSNNSKNNIDSDFFMHKADYLKIRTIQLGYKLPKSLTEKVNIQKARFYVNLENYILLTKWPGQDPENSNTDASKSELMYPILKTMSFGVNLSF